MVFSPDGTQLIAGLREQPRIRIWDLRAVRRRLADLNLDWSPSPSWGSASPIPEPGTRPRPYRVDRGRMDDWVRSSHLKGHEQQVADADAMLNQDPGRPEVREWLATSCNNLAWVLITGPESRRDPARALHLARRALALNPDGAVFLNTLGLALYRVGHYQEATRAIERSLATNLNASASHDLFILALCHARQADLGQSRSYFDRAVSRLKSSGGAATREDQELSDLRAEAEAAIRASLPNLPVDVFAPEPVGPSDY